MNKTSTQIITEQFSKFKKIKTQIDFSKFIVSISLRKKLKQTINEFRKKYRKKLSLIEKQTKQNVFL